jgi:hypothetical protein
MIRVLSFSVALLVSLLLIQGASAQHALDANLEVGSNGLNRRSTTSPNGADFRARNLIVTDSIAGGRGFRGDVGYSASGDFTGSLGSDDSLAFRSNSALSDLLFITSPQRLDAFNIAQGTGVFEYRPDFASLPQVNNVYAGRSINDAKIRLDRTSISLQSGSLLATSVAASDVGYVTKSDVQYAVTSSTLEGIGVRPQATSFENLSIYDRAEARQAMARSGASRMDVQPVPFVSEFDRANYAAMVERLAERGEEPPAMMQARINQAGGSGASYDAIVERILEQYADRKNIRLDGLTRETTMRDASASLGRVEGLITGRLRRDQGGGLKSDDFRNTSERYDGVPRSPLEGFATGGDPKDDESPAAVPGFEDPSAGTDPTSEEGDGDAKTLSVDEMAKILSHRMEVTELSITDRSRLARAVHQGEAALQEGRFFKAERRFEDAIQINPGNPLLELARANAQIGAGLYLSAALTLDRTFATNPEVIDARFKPQLLPNRTRLDLAVVAIRERLDRGHDLEGYGISLAYIGHQLGNAALMTEGLAFVKGTEDVTLFGRLLRGIWLGDPVDPNTFVDPLPEPVAPEALQPEAPKPEEIPGPSLVP